jgi:flavin reductase (DIM6/NTAB) family NADH-FMN oxidoreductase RutF
MKRSLGPKALLYPAPVMVIGTYDKQGKPDVMTASWGGICSSQPPCIAISIRKATYTYENLTKRQAFTINLPSEDQVKQADYIGLISGRTADKFKATKLKATKSKLVDAPCVKEFPLVLECKVVAETDLGIYTQFIGEVLDVKAEESVLGAGGSVEISLLKPLIYTPDTQEYYGVGPRVENVFSAGKAL